MDTSYPLNSGTPVSHDLGPDLVDAICQQVLQIVSRPLFPVTWRDMTGQVGEETPRLTALDVTGQIVSVEIPEAPGLRDPHYVTVASGSRGVAVLVGSGG